jgi:hypothetical protein
VEGPGHLDLASAQDDVNGRGEQPGIVRHEGLTG